MEPIPGKTPLDIQRNPTGLKIDVRARIAAAALTLATLPAIGQSIDLFITPSAHAQEVPTPDDNTDDGMTLEEADNILLVHDKEGNLIQRPLDWVLIDPSEVFVGSPDTNSQ